jgi:two-component sensor histidine kinase
VLVTASIPREEALATFRQSLDWSLAAGALLLALLGGLTLVAFRLVARDERAQAQLSRVNGELAAANVQLSRALEDRTTLLEEIHHRVRNNLAVTSSLLRIQSRSFTDPAVRAAFLDTEDRLRSISLLHETLYRVDATGSVRLDDYLTRLAKEVAAAHGSQQRNVDVTVDAEPIEVPLNRAVPLGLAVTEALSNAFKHAFGEGNGGRIRVSGRRAGWRVRGGSARHRPRPPQRTCPSPATDDRSARGSSRRSPPSSPRP